MFIKQKLVEFYVKYVFVLCMIITIVLPALIIGLVGSFEMQYTFIGFIVGCVTYLLLVDKFLMKRNKWVHDTRYRILSNDFNNYENYKDYDYMFAFFWIWDVKKFLKKSDG